MQGFDFGRIPRICTRLWERIHKDSLASAMIRETLGEDLQGFARIHETLGEDLQGLGRLWERDS